MPKKPLLPALDLHKLVETLATHDLCPGHFVHGAPKLNTDKKCPENKACTECFTDILKMYLSEAILSLPEKEKTEEK
jgi:hypothetical protein